MGSWIDIYRDFQSKGLLNFKCYTSEIEGQKYKTFALHGRLSQLGFGTSPAVAENEACANLMRSTYIAFQLNVEDRFFSVPESEDSELTTPADWDPINIKLEEDYSDDETTVDLDEDNEGYIAYLRTQRQQVIKIHTKLLSGINLTKPEMLKYAKIIEKHILDLNKQLE